MKRQREISILEHQLIESFRKATKWSSEIAFLTMLFNIKNDLWTSKKKDIYCRYTSI